MSGTDTLTTSPLDPEKWDTGKRGPSGSIATGNGPTRAAVILPWDRGGTGPARASDARLEEAVGLSAAIGLVVVHQAVLPLRARKPATLLGGGQVETLGQIVNEQQVDVVIVDATLSPVQQRNLERAWNCKVIDRTALILDIFGERAATDRKSVV